jgi:hypothetical protein
LDDADEQNEPRQSSIGDAKVREAVNLDVTARRSHAPSRLSAQARKRNCRTLQPRARPRISCAARSIFFCANWQKSPAYTTDLLDLLHVLGRLMPWD